VLHRPVEFKNESGHIALPLSDVDSIRQHLWRMIDTKLGTADGEMQIDAVHQAVLLMQI
jgi:hypothetical protein